MVAAGFYLVISRVDWMVLVLVIGLVWVAEAMNTALEYLCDAAMPDQHPLIRKAKDVAAGGVLIAAGLAVITGLMLFLPYL